MLSQEVMEQWFSTNDIPENGVRLIEIIRSSEPARKVRSGRSNVPGNYPSKKMGHTVQFESHRVELAGVLEYETDTNILEYWDQPNKIKLRYPSINNKVVGLLHVPDFFIIRTDCAGWEEWKKEEDLQQLAIKSPNRYINENGVWRCPPGEQYAEQYGFYYRLRSSEEINWVYRRNINFLDDYLREENSNVLPDDYLKILACVNSNLGIKLIDLIQTDGIDPDDVYRLFVSGELYVDLFKQPLAEPHTVRVFANRNFSESFQEPVYYNDGSSILSLNIEVAIGNTIMWDMRPWRIINIGETNISLLNENSTSIDLPNETFQGLVNMEKIKGIPREENPIKIEIKKRFEHASPAELEMANRRLDIIAPILRGEPDTDTTLAARTKRHLVKLFREGVAIYGNGYVNLIPKISSRGNRQRRLADTTLNLITEVIDEFLKTPEAISKYLAYGVLQKLGEERDIYCPSFPTFLNDVERSDMYDYELKRAGKKSAYKHEPFYNELDATTPRHGDRPFEIAHIDHTLFDIELKNRAGFNLGKPWLTLLTDAFSRRFLAFYLTFWKPSIVSCMMVIRECVRRHNRLPQTIVVDGGGEFHSLYFDTLLARYEIAKKVRPGAKPRYGNVVERLFGTTNTQFVHNLAGNTKIMKNVRLVTPGFNPKELAEWTLKELYIAMSEYAFEYYDTRDHPALGMSPREAFEQGIAISGSRPYRLIPYNDDFLDQTLVSTRKGAAKIIPDLGFQLLYRHYWNEIFRRGDVRGSTVPIKFDPMNMGHAKAFVKGKWYDCRSSNYNTFNGKSLREIQIASEEIRRRAKLLYAGRTALDSKGLADFFESIEGKRHLARQHDQDMEIASMLELIHGGKRQEEELGFENLEPDLLEGIDEELEFTNFKEF